MGNDFTQLSEVDVWKVSSSLPQAVRRVLDAYPQLFVGGGFIRSCLNDEEVKDIDIFTTNLSIVDDAARLCADLFKQQLRKEITTRNTPNTITIGTGFVPVQFINSIRYDTRENTLRSFDFTVCQAAYWREAGFSRTLCTKAFLRDIPCKRLIYTHPNRKEAAGGSLWRAFKLTQRGYSIDQRTVAALASRLCMGLVSWGHGVVSEEGLSSEILECFHVQEAYGERADP